MPKGLLRLIVVLLVALAVPVQGIAALAAGVCMALGHHAGAASAHDHGADGHGHDGSPAPYHDEQGKGSGKSSAHCPPCASCCATAAIASFPVVALPDRPVTSLIAKPAAFFAGVLPHRLDRPPLAL